ncbi:MAG: fatty acid desaturase, partial [Pseudomonadales bacterium]
QRSGRRAISQTSLHLGLLLGALVVAAYFQLHQQWVVLCLAVSTYSLVNRFSVNALHELTHGTVFRNHGLNITFANVFGFFGHINRPYFWLSHREHHRFSLHQPLDGEVVEPELHDLFSFFKNGIVSLNPMTSLAPLVELAYLACGVARGEWQQYLLARAEPAELRQITRFSRVCLSGHLLLSLAALLTGLWILPVMLLGFRQFLGLPFLLCNNSQHAGLRDRSADFRLCCRTFYLSFPLRFLYWNMNYHIEHHMYPGVPFYNLADLHEAIKYDLPPIETGLFATWREISETVRRQKSDPGYRLDKKLPAARI